ncbi:hypothetical protein WN51_02340 [Melipona quadrifasciata]|uniref:Uncharacterized protein n=1 Tax=Melipona quadrifasciata TaxID=166423 RepID=A0A0M8ZV52_9HYME|nr:hypothetical protein WN51_02340 [Melipona quadrifasciata]
MGTRSSKVKEDGSARSMVVLRGTCSRAGEQEQIVDILSQQLRDLAKYFATDRGNGFVSCRITINLKTIYLLLARENNFQSWKVTKTQSYQNENTELKNVNLHEYS